MSEGTKVCKICHDEKPVIEFYKSPNMADGLENRCKACHLVQQQANTKRKAEGIGNPKRIYTVMSDEERAVSLAAYKAYQRKYHHEMNKAKAEKNKREKLERIIRDFGSVEAYKEYQHQRGVAASKAWRAKQKEIKLAEEDAKVLTVLDFMEEITT